jgi:hypothetical protein
MRSYLVKVNGEYIMGRQCIFVALVFPLLLFYPLQAVPSDDEEALILLTESIARVTEIADYTVTIHQVQRVAGKILPEEVLFVKFMRPNSLYIRWIGEVKNGREVLYREGSNDNKLLVHGGGVLRGLSLSLDPTSRLGMTDTRHPIHESSIIYMMEHLNTSLAYSRSHPHEEVSIELIGDDTVFGREVKKIRLRFPYGDEYPYYAPESIFGIDTETLLPLFYSAFGTGGEFWEEYRFKNLRINNGLTDWDFDPENSDYSFP